MRGSSLFHNTANNFPLKSVRRVRPKERGYILIMTCFSLTFLLGVAGLAIDVGRMYITKNEAQAYADSAAVNAALKLDGTSAGITAATSSTSSDTGKWRFDTQAFSTVTTSFATSATGTYTTSPPNPPTGYNYVKVTASVNLPMYLIRPLSGPTATIGATAIAYRRSITSLPSGEFPFSPYTRVGLPENANDPYGYQIGNQYTLRWGSPGTNSTCGTDQSLANQQNSIVPQGKIRGYCCVSQSAASLRQAIVGGQTDPITIGQNMPMDNGAKDTEMSAIAQRVNMDSNTTSTTYADYVASGTGNGERVVVVAVNSGSLNNFIAVGFAAFFLLTPDSYTGLGGNDSACAEYIGAWTQGQPNPSGTGSGAYHIRLAQ